MTRSFFSPPVFENADDNFRARFINGFAWVVIGLLSFVLFADGQIVFSTANVTDGVLVALIAVHALALFLLRRNRVVASGWIIILMGWSGLTFQAYQADGVKDVVVIAYIAIALLASIVVSWRAGGIVIAASILMIQFLAYLEVNQLITPRFQNPEDFARDLTFVFIAITALIYFSTTSLRDAIARAGKSEENLRHSNAELQSLNLTLENRVATRTTELEGANQRNEKRARQFEAIARVARTATTNQTLESLLPEMAELISAQFGFYHTGLFLLDEEREFALLMAANSPGGKRMLDRGHRLGVGSQGIVGYVSATGRARIALDVGDDAVFFNNPDLPTTRSEMALPLRAAETVIGVLDVQSTEANAFQPEDIEVLSTLADQVAIAIQNARSYETLQGLLQQAQRTSGTLLRDSWRILNPQEAGLIGYQANEDKVQLLARPIASEHVDKAITLQSTIRKNGENAVLAIPIRLRDQVIGVLNIQVPEEHDWETDEVDIAEAIADRLSLALESSLLLKTTQRRAELERITAEMTGKIGATTQFDTILRTAAEELSRALGGSEVLVQIQPDAWRNNETQERQS